MDKARRDRISVSELIRKVLARETSGPARKRR